MSDPFTERTLSRDCAALEAENRALRAEVERLRAVVAAMEEGPEPPLFLEGANPTRVQGRDDG